MRFGLICASVLLLFVVFSSRSFALESDDSGYFDFTLSQNPILDNQEILIDFNWDIKDFDLTAQKRLTVKPLLSGGTVQIYHEDANRYVGIAELGTAYPYLRETMTVRFTGIQSSELPFLLKFVICDTLTNREYFTPTHQIWGTGYYQKYTALLNDNLVHVLPDSVETGKAIIDPPPVSAPVTFYFWYLAPAFFLCGLLKSAHGVG